MIYLSKVVNIIDEDTDIKKVEEKFDSGCSILYVVDRAGKYIGCITRSELFTILQQKRLVVNHTSYKIQCGEDEKARAEKLFDAHRSVYNIPVVDEKGLLLYEYIRELVDENFDSVKYWEERYKEGGNSGGGSYSKLAEFKAEVLNDFIMKNSVNSVIEWGFGDGNQLNLLSVPSYTGYDVSETAYRMCKERFAHDKNKKFLHYDGTRMSDCKGIYDMAMSLDVLYHLVEDDKFNDYLYNLFNSSNKYVCIYASDYDEKQRVKHIKRRKFTEYVKNEFSEWEMILFVKNPYLYEMSNSNFYFYERICD